MSDKENEVLIKRARRVLRRSSLAMIFVLLITIAFGVFPGFFSPQEANDEEAQQAANLNQVIDGIHVRTGLLDAEGMYMVIANCTNCHSAKLVTQNRMSAERWNETIEWMQETQNLWDLGENQEVIVNYLVTNYPPDVAGGRRSNLTNIEWYEHE